MQFLEDASKAIGVGSGIALTVIAGGFIGYKLGRTVNLGPVGLVVGLLAGLTAAMTSVMRVFSE